MLISDYKKLPEEVETFIWNTVSDKNYDISDKYSLTFDQFQFINQIEDDIILKKKDPIDLPKYLKKMPGNFSGDFRELALFMAKDIFWPLQEYLSGVDRLILRLGGKVPKPVVLKKKSPVTEDNILHDEFVGKVRELMKISEEFKNLPLTDNKIINKDQRHASPSVANWIEDYVHFLGAGEHSSLDRAKYLSKSHNAENLTEEAKESLRFLLLSYDEDEEVSFDKSSGLLEVSTKQSIHSEADTNMSGQSDMSGMFRNFGDKLKNIENILIADDIIMSEAQGDVNKVRDILWDSIGIGDSDKAISCLKVLISKQAFDSMLKEDKRFKNILKRFIGIRYGQSMERALDENIDKLIAKRLFLEMLLADKLKLKEDQLYPAAFYLTNLMPGLGQVIYFDKKDEQFKWLEIQVVANKFVWVDKF